MLTLIGGFIGIVGGAFLGFITLFYFIYRNLTKTEDARQEALGLGDPCLQCGKGRFVVLEAGDLDTRQQARFRVFEEQIERRKLDLLVRARARALQKQQ